MAIIFDSHTHSDNSPDGSHSITFMCEKAVEKGLSGLCITDHCEMNVYKEERFDLRIAQSIFETNKEGRVFNGQLSVLSGIEISDVFYDLDLTNQVLGSIQVDQVIVSQHTSEDHMDVYYSNFKLWSSQQIHEYLEWYFRYLLEVARWDGYDVMGHLTYPIRYISGVHHIPVDLSRYQDLIDQVLETVASKGKAIELNTSGLRQVLGDTMPNFHLLKRFRELGGEYVTLGSDAHKAEELGEGIPRAMEMLEEAGFEYRTVYKEHQPLQFKIV